MKKRVILVGTLFLALVAAGIGVFLPFGAETLGPITASPQAMIHPLTVMAKATRETTRIVRGTEGEVRWREQVYTHADHLLTDYTVNDQILPSVARFASEVLGRPVSVNQVVDVNGTAQEMLASLRLNQISASQDSVFFVEENGTRILVVKAFRDFTRRDSLFLPQLSACAAIQDLRLQHSYSMDLRGVGKCMAKGTPYALLAMGVSPGRMVGEYIHAVIQHPVGSKERTEAFALALRAVERVAVALAELHSAPSKGTTRRTAEQTAAQFMQAENSVHFLAHRGKDLDVDTILTKVKDCELRCQSAAIQTAFCHGGINWKNFLFEPLSDRLTMIDTAGLHRELDPWDQPQGVAEAELAQLEQRLLAMDPSDYSQEELQGFAKTLSTSYFAHLKRPWSEDYYRLAVDGFHLERMREWVRKKGNFKEPSEQKRADDGLDFALAYFRNRP